MLVRWRIDWWGGFGNLCEVGGLDEEEDLLTDIVEVGGLQLGCTKSHR